MADLPPVYIIITTYNRTSLALETIRGLKTYLQYPSLYWHIADDGSREEHIPALLQEIGNVPVVNVTNVNRRGVGASKNAALLKAWEYTPLVLLLEDDWVLTSPFDLIPHADMLMKTNIGMVRYGFLGSATETLTAKWVSLNGLPYWKLMRGSDVYVYSGQVSLRHKRFYEACGYHAENLTAGEEELEFCKRFNGVENAPDIVWPGNLAAHWGPFKNIGFAESLNNIQPE